MVLHEKEKKREQDKIQKEKEMQRIREENIKLQNENKKRKDKEYNQSSVKQIIGGESSYDFEESLYNDEDFMDEDILGEIREEDEQIEDERTLLEEEILRRDERIEQLNETLKETTKKMNLELSDSAEEETELDGMSAKTPFSISDIGDSEEETNNVELEIVASFQSKIEKFKERCISGVGRNNFEQCYRFLKQKEGVAPEELRPKVVELLGEGLIGYWHLVNQILFYEDCLDEAQQIF